MTAKLPTTDITADDITIDRIQREKLALSDLEPDPDDLGERHVERPVRRTPPLTGKQQKEE